MPRRLRDNFTTPLLAALAGMAFLVAPVSPARAQYRMDVLPQGYGQDLSMPRIIDKAGSPVPLDLEFTNTDGQKIKLDSLFHHEKPVIIDMVYFSCPYMCGESQNQLAQAVLDKTGGLTIGKDYDVVVVSIDPDDTLADAKQKRDRYAGMMKIEPGQPGLTYLIGSESNIKTLADDIGFAFKRNAPNNADKFVHQPGIIICTPEGKVSHTITGLVYSGDELYKSLRTASNGRIGSGFTALAVSCGAMKYNPLTGKYEHNPYFWVGTATGLVTLLTVGGFLTMLWRAEKRKDPPPADSSTPAPTP